MDNTTERLAKLAAQVEYPESWRPVVGETLTGEAVRWEADVEVAMKDGTTRSCDILVIKTAEGRERSVWTWHAVLKDELIGEEVDGARPPLGEKVKPGDLVALHYRGKQPRQSGDGEWDGYRVAIDSTPATEPDWEQVAAHGRAEDEAVAPGAPYDPATAPFPEEF